jgi:putative tricarboxylic transport membrane protein
MTDQPRGLARGDLGIAVGVVALGLIAAWQTTEIPQSAYAAVGPRVFAWTASAMLIVMGLFLVKDAIMGGWSHESDEFGEVDWPGGLWMIAGLLANVVLIDLDLGAILGRIMPGLLDWSRVGTVGFILSSTVLFVFTARAFGSTKLPRDAVIGFLLAFVSYVGFDRVLGYKIGSGLIEALI